MQITRIRFSIRRLMIAVAVIAIAVGLGVLFLRPTSLAVSIRIVNKTAYPLGNLEYNIGSQTGGTIKMATPEVIRPGEMKIQHLAISGGAWPR